jgi:hypothetical protein
MGLFGKKKDYTESALEEARRFDQEDAKDRATSTPPTTAQHAKVKNLSVTTSISTSGDSNAAIADLMEKAFGGNLMDASKVAPGEAVSVTTVRHVGANDAQLKDAIAALGLGPGASTQASGGGAQKPDSGFSAALDVIEREYRGKPPAEAKAAIEAALKKHHHTIPDMVVDILAKGVSEGTTIDIKFG